VADLPQVVPIDLTLLATTMTLDFGFGFRLQGRLIRGIGYRRVQLE